MTPPAASAPTATDGPTTQVLDGPPADEAAVQALTDARIAAEDAAAEAIARAVAAEERAAAAESQAAKAKAAGKQPRSAAARRAAGEQVTEPEGTDPVLAAESQVVTPGAPAPAHAGVAAVTDDGPVSVEELAQFRAFKQARSAEIAAAIAAAPVAIGTDINPYTLVHLRGCPQPTRTETYQVKDPRNRDWTVHRCIECGAHLSVPH